MIDILAQRRLPRWMKAQLPTGEKYSKVKNLIATHQLHTICTSGNCPNKGECWSAGTASFMILGDKCTRNCRFCLVKNMRPDPVDWAEPERLAKTIQTLNLKHCVITSVDRDDLDDGGASFWVQTIKAIKALNPSTTMEVLIPDFWGKSELLQLIIDAKPEVISHNVETVRRLTPKIRSNAYYERSLSVIKYVSDAGVVSKSGIMVGLGETTDEVLETMRDLRNNGCKVLTVGQYLQPASHLARVEAYITPETFEMFRQEGLKMGFSYIESSPLVRSSYHAEQHVFAK
jgi:lipoic acid synthetase